MLDFCSSEKKTKDEMLSKRLYEEEKGMRWCVSPMTEGKSFRADLSRDLFVEEIEIVRRNTKGRSKEFYLVMQKAD